MYQTSFKYRMLHCKLMTDDYCQMWLQNLMIVLHLEITLSLRCYCLAVSNFVKLISLSQYYESAFKTCILKLIPTCLLWCWFAGKKIGCKIRSLKNMSYLLFRCTSLSARNLSHLVEINAHFESYGSIVFY